MPAPRKLQLKFMYPFVTGSGGVINKQQANMDY